MYGPKTHQRTRAWTQPDQSKRGMMSVFLQLERSEPTTWEVTSTRVQKHSLSTMLSKRANNDSFSNSKALTLNSDHSIRSFNASILAHCLLTRRKNLSCSLSTYTLSSSVGIRKEICLITVGLTEANVATVLAGWLSK